MNIIVVRYAQKNNKVAFKYIGFKDVLSILKKDYNSIHVYNTKQEAAYAESLQLAIVNKAFYVVRSNKMINGNGIFLDKRTALNFKKSLNEFNSVMTIELNERAAYNLIGQRKLGVDEIKAAREVIGKIAFTAKKEVTPDGVNLMRQVVRSLNRNKDYFKKELASTTLAGSVKTEILNIFNEAEFRLKEAKKANQTKKSTPAKKKTTVQPKKAPIKPLVTVEVAPIITGITTEEIAATVSTLVEVNETLKTVEQVEYVGKVQDKKKNLVPMSTRQSKFFVETVTSKANMNPSIKIYCDGSYSDTLGGFYGYAAYNGDTLVAQKTGFVFDGLFGKSSGGAENMSIINALEWAYANDINEVEIFYDAQENVGPLLQSKEQGNAIRNSYRNIVEKFLKVMDIKFTYVDKDGSIHQTRHNLINNIIYEKRKHMA